MSDMSKVIEPKSDQLNADSLVSGSMTIKITRVSIAESGEQKVSVFFEGDNGKPWKPCKSMCRVMVKLWGKHACNYVGKSMTIYCDPKVKWGGEEVGGIRISHMSDIEGATEIALTVTRGNKKPFKVRPLSPPPVGSKKDTPDIDVEALRKEGIEAVSRGTDTLKAFWERLKPAEQKLLSQDIATWKTSASLVDAENKNSEHLPTEEGEKLSNIFNAG